MRKNTVFEDTSELLLAAFPVLLKGFKEVVDIIPSPVGSVVKGAVQGAIFLMDKTEEYKESKEEIYLLSARVAQVLIMLVNEWVEHRSDYRNIERVDVIIREISTWVERRSPSGRRRDKLIQYLKADDTIEDVRRFNGRLDNAIALSQLHGQMMAQQSLVAITESVDTTKSNINKMELFKAKFPISNRVKTLFPNDSRCLPGTHKDILQHIKDWLDRPESGVQMPSIFWLTGVAGCGKSTISRSIIDLAQEKKITCSYFFFSRDFDDRRGLDKLMTTVASDFISSGQTTLAQKIYDAVLNKNISGNSSFFEQVEAYLKAPLSTAKHPVLIVWDGLDECTEPNSRQSLLQLLCALPSLPTSIRVMVTSRTVRDLEMIREQLKPHIWHHDLTFNADNEEDSTIDDITAFIADVSHDMHKWLRSEDIPKLVELADGLFVAAQFICRYLSHPIWGKTRLVSFLKNPNYSEGGQSTTMTLHNWYYTSLKHIFSEDGVDEINIAKRIMSLIFVAQYPLSGSLLATILEIEEWTVTVILDSLSPFLILNKNKTGVRYVHRSIRDFFLSDMAKEFHIIEITASANVAVPCLQILLDQTSEAFKSSILPNPLSDSQVEPIEYTVRVSEALAYASHFWGYHLKDVTNLTEVRGYLYAFYYTHLIEWLHIMGSKNALTAAISSLEWVQSWGWLHYSLIYHN